MSTGWMIQVANIPETPPITNGWITSKNLVIPVLGAWVPWGADILLKSNYKLIIRDISKLRRHTKVSEIVQPAEKWFPNGRFTFEILNMLIFLDLFSVCYKRISQTINLIYKEKPCLKYIYNMIYNQMFFATKRIKSLFGFLLVIICLFSLA